MSSRIRTILKDNGLSIALISFFLVFAAIQAVAGWHTRNEELALAGQQTDTLAHYLTTGHFGEALFENWESEFLQMGAYVFLTVYLVQRGSPESKPLDEGDREDDYPENAGPDSPAWSRVHGIRQLIYRNSLSIALFTAFALSFVAHLITGTIAHNEELALEGQPPESVASFFTSPDFWFQSMQNWQSEFLAIGSLVLLSIVLRQHGSPQSKPVTAPHHETGSG